MIAFSCRLSHFIPFHSIIKLLWLLAHFTIACFRPNVSSNLRSYSCIFARWIMWNRFRFVNKCNNINGREPASQVYRSIISFDVVDLYTQVHHVIVIHTNWSQQSLYAHTHLPMNFDNWLGKINNENPSKVQLHEIRNKNDPQKKQTQQAT